MNLMQNETTALAVAASRPQFDMSPQTFEQALTFSDYLAKSDMVPKNYQGKAGNCLIAMQWGFEIGLKPLQALQSIAVINGKPSIYGDAGKALLLHHGCIIEEDDTEIIKKNGIARCTITRPNRRPVSRTFSLEDAKSAGLLNKDGPWKQYQSRQMAWRAFWFAARDAASDLLRGLNGAEEAQDIQPRDMGMADVVQPSKAEPTTWPDDLFAARLPEWLKAINAGRATADAVIAKAQTKHALTEAQLAAIRAPASKAEAADAGPVVTFAQVADAIAKAETIDELAEAADLIGSVADAGHRTELTAKYQARLDQLTK